MANVPRSTGGRSPFWIEVSALTTVAAEVGASRDAWADRDQDGAFDALSETMVRSIQVVGPIDSVREQLLQRSEQGADLQMVQMPQGNPAEAGAFLQQLLS